MFDLADAIAQHGGDRALLVAAHKHPICSVVRGPNWDADIANTIRK